MPNTLKTNRFWDPKGNYIEGFVKEYKYWTLEVSYRQHTLGCFIIFCKRPVEKISELTDTEIIELKIVMKEFEEKLTSNVAFRPDRFNYLQLGNKFHNLHFHAIPRYKAVREFGGKTWIDSTYGHPVVWTKETIPIELVRELKLIM